MTIIDQGAAPKADAAIDVADVDLSNIDRFRDNEGWAQFDALRHADPVHWTQESDGKGFWAVTKYDDIWAVDKDSETFTSEQFVNLEDVDDDLMDFRRSILETDGARHAALRKLIQREFSPRNLLKNYEAFLRELTKNTVDEAKKASPNGEFDFVEKISADFPIQVLARLLDVPREHTGQLIQWGNEMVANTDPDYTEHLLDSPESEKYRHLPFRSPTVQDVWDYGRDLRDKRVGGDGKDLVSILANKMPEDGVPLTDQDFNNYFSLLVIAGNETTRHAISQIMLGLIAQPDQFKAMRMTRRSSSRASRSCCAGRRPSTTSVGRRRRTSSSAASRSRQATRSSCGSLPATATRTSSPSRTRST